MKMGKWLRSLWLVALMTAVLLAPAANASEIVIDEPVTLKVLWCQDTTASNFEYTIEEKMAEAYPNITLEWELITWQDLPSKMQQYMQSGMPDVVFAKSQDANNFGGYGVWADLTDEPYIQNVYEAALGGVTIDGKILGMPYIGTYGGVYYNREIFAQYGLEPPKTIEELKAICETLKANNIVPFASHFLDAWYHGWTVCLVVGSELISVSETWGDEFRDGQRNASDEEFRIGLEMMEFIHENTWADTYSVEQTTCDARFVKGEAAMQLDGSWVAINYATLNPDFDYGIFPFPTSQGNGCLNLEPNMTFFKSATTEHEDAADALLSLMATPEMASEWSQYVGESSLIKGAESFNTPAQDDIDLYAGMGLTRDQNKITNQLPYNEFWDGVSSDFTEYRNGDVTMETLLERANARRDVCGE